MKAAIWEAEAGGLQLPGFSGYGEIWRPIWVASESLVWNLEGRRGLGYNSRVKDLPNTRDTLGSVSSADRNKLCSLIYA